MNASFFFILHSVKLAAELINTVAQTVTTKVRSIFVYFSVTKKLSNDINLKV